MRRSRKGRGMPESGFSQPARQQLGLRMRHVIRASLGNWDGAKADPDCLTDQKFCLVRR